MKKEYSRKFLALVILAFTSATLFAQNNGISAVNDALSGTTSELTTLFDTIKKICYIAAGIVGIAGAVKVYSSFTGGDQDATKKAAYWLGGAIIFAALVYITDKVFINGN